VWEKGAMSKQGMLHGLRRKLALLLDPEEAHEKPKVPAAPSRHPDREEPDFDARVGDLLRRSGRPQLLSGRISLIDLGEIEQKFGSSWQRLADRAERIARATIERHLMPGDIYTAMEPLSFIVVFASLSAVAAQTKCLMIADRIRKTLLGDEGAEQFAVKASVSAIDSSFRLAADRPLDEVSQVNVVAHGADDAEHEPVEDADGSCASDPASRFWYRPMWHQPRNVVSAYLCVDRPQAFSTGKALPADTASPAPHTTLDHDEAARDQVLSDLAGLVRSGRRFLLGVQVDFETLASAMRRREYAAGLARRLDGAAAELLILEIVNAPVGVPQSRLVAIIATLRPHCRGVLLRLPADTTEMNNLRGCGLTAVGCEILGGRGSEHTVLQHINRFSRAAENSGLSTYLLGANTRSIVAACVGAGFRYVGGDAVAEPVERPDQLVEFQLADLYRPFLPA
jgi:hypothetical protein